MLSNFLLPIVYAEDEKVVEFTVEQTDEEIKTDKDETKDNNIITDSKENNEKTPSTGDNIYYDLILAIGGIVLTYLLIKKIKNKKRTLI